MDRHGAKSTQYKTPTLLRSFDIHDSPCTLLRLIENRVEAAHILQDSKSTEKILMNGMFFLSLNSILISSLVLSQRYGHSRHAPGGQFALAQRYDTPLSLVLYLS